MIVWETTVDSQTQKKNQVNLGIKKPLVNLENT